MNLSPHFTYNEMVFSQTAIAKGIKNIPNSLQIEAFRNLCVSFLEPLRAMLGKPIHITSGFRNPELNKLVGGSPSSQHQKAEAVDIQVDGMTTQELFEFIIASGLVYDQLIEEFDSWCHVSLRMKGKQRMMSMWAMKGARGGTFYVKKEYHAVTPKLV